MADRIEFGGGCQELCEAASLPAVSCCGSCHSEWEGDYSEPNDREFNGKEYHVCCTVSGAFDKASAAPAALSPTPPAEAP